MAKGKITIEHDVTIPSPEPAAADSFTVPTDGDSFTPPTEEQTQVLWSELRQLLARLASVPATMQDRQDCNALLNRLGLAVELAPLLLTVWRESVELQRTIDQGQGQAQEAARIRREIQSYLNLSAGDPQTNQKNAESREKLAAEHTAASLKADAAARAAGGKRHLESWLPELFGLPNPWKEKDEMGRPKKCGGLLTTTICPNKTAEAAANLMVDPYVPDSWKTLRRPEPIPARRRYRTTAISSPSPITTLGQTPYNRF
jgi:hypothetical protein